MARTNYVRGREKEYACRDTLVAVGYSCTRSASSQGLWDVVGVRGDEIRLVQTKLTSSGNFSEDENCKDFRDLPVPPNCRKELWLYAKGEGLIEIRDLKEPKLSAVNAEGKAAREVARDRARTMRALSKPIRK